MFEGALWDFIYFYIYQPLLGFIRLDRAGTWRVGYAWGGRVLARPVPPQRGARTALPPSHGIATNDRIVQALRMAAAPPQREEATL